MILIVYQLFRWPWPFPSLIIPSLSHRPPVLLSQSSAALLGFRPADGLVALGSVFFRVMMPANMVAAVVVVVVAVAGPVEFATGFFTLRLFFFSVGDVIIFFFFFVFLAGQTRPRFRQI
jgi:ABC-type transport system involved in cytochrome bd biosynthesis fused ATPase/permease subunit